MLEVTHLVDGTPAVSPGLRDLEHVPVLARL